MILGRSASKPQPTYPRLPGLALQHRLDRVDRRVRGSDRVTASAASRKATLGPDLGVADAGRNEVYASMNWLLTRQDVIDAELARRHLRGNGQRGNDQRGKRSRGQDDVRLVLVVGGGQLLPPGRRGYSRDGRKAKLKSSAAVRSGGAPGRDSGVLR